MDEPIAREDVNDLHQQYLEDGGTHSQVNILELVRMIGGIDKILNDYLTNPSLSLSTRRLEYIYELLWSLTGQDQDDLTHTNGLIPDDLIRYTFNQNNTYLHYFYGHTVADKIVNIINHKITVFILLFSIISWLVMLMLYGNTVIYPVFALPTVGCIWMPFTILWLLSANISGIKLITKTFEFWFKVVYAILFVISYQIDWWLYQPQNHTEHIDLHQYILVLYGIVCFIIIFGLSILDAFKIKRIYKLCVTTLIAIALSMLSFLCQFTSECGKETVITIRGDADIQFSLTSIEQHATRILAIFIWKQAILTMIRKDKTVTMNYTPCVQWITIEKSERDDKSKTNTKSKSKTKTKTKSGTKNNEKSKGSSIEKEMAVHLSPNTNNTTNGENMNDIKQRINPNNYHKRARRASFDPTKEETIMDSYLANHYDHKLDDALLFSTTITHLSDTVNPDDTDEDEEKLTVLRRNTLQIKQKTTETQTRDTITITAATAVSPLCATHAPIGEKHVTTSNITNLTAASTGSGFLNINNNEVNLTPVSVNTPNSNGNNRPVLPLTDRFTFTNHTHTNTLSSRPIRTHLNTNTNTELDNKEEKDTDSLYIAKKKSHRKDLELKCMKLSTMNSKFRLDIVDNLQIILVHEFENIDVESFWDKFWSNDAIFSPIDWIKDSSTLVSNIEATEWRLDTNKDGENDWHIRHLTCIQRSDDDMHSDMDRIVYISGKDAKDDINIKTRYTTECKHELKYAKIKPGFFIATKMSSFVNFMNIHQKFELRQNAKVVKNRNDEYKIAISTNMKIYFGVEWLKQIDDNISDIESRELVRVRDDCLKYCQFIDDKILAMNSKNKIKNKKKMKMNGNVTIEMEDLSFNEPSCSTVSTML